MGKASSGKKVARAASTGGGRTSRGKTPWGWYSLISAVVILGVALVVVSRDDTLDRIGERSTERPTTNDHWHAAYGFYFCDQFSPPLADNGRDPLGVHTHGDGVIHVHPFSQAASGKRAVMAVYERAMGITLDDDKLDIGDREFSNGDMCGDKPGKVQTFVDGEPFNGDPSDIHFGKDRQAVVVAFAPEGAEIPRTPPSFAQLNNLSDMPAQPPGSDVPNEATTSTTNPTGGETTTSVPGTSPSSSTP